MANEYQCSTCKGDVTRCDCHKKRGPRPYQPTPEELHNREVDEIEREWRKLGIKPPKMGRL